MIRLKYYEFLNQYALCFFDMLLTKYIDNWSDKLCNAICLMIGCEILDDFVYCNYSMQYLQG